MDRKSQYALPSLTTLATMVVVLAIAWVAREILIPIAIAAFLGLLLHPLVTRLERWGVNRLLGAAIVTLAALVPVLGVAWVIGSEFVSLLNTLPQYEGNIQDKISSLEGPLGNIVARVTRMADGLHLHEMAAQHQAAGPEPLPVKVVDPAPTPWSVVSDYAGSVLGPLLTAGIVLVFLVFMLAQWEDLRDRVLRLLSADRLTSTTSALEELTDRVAGFLRVQFLLNVGIGLTVGTGMWLIGVPSAFLWGFMAGALRYVPYIGQITAITLAMIITVATSSGWGKPLVLLGFYTTAEVVINNFVEPYIYGSTTGVSSIAVLAAIVVWGWLWGLPGIILATPISVCMVVAGRYVPRLRFLSILLGDDPVLEPPERMYQRLVARNADEAAETAEEFLKEHDLVRTFDELLIPSLRDADSEREDGNLEEDQQEFVRQAVRDIVDELARKWPPLRRERELKSRGIAVPAHIHSDHGREDTPADASRATALRVLCVPARDESDALAGSMLEAAAADRPAPRNRRLEVRALSVEDLGTDLAEIIGSYGADLVLVSAVPPHAGHDCRVRGKQARRKSPGTKLVAGLWGAPLSEGPARDRVLGAGFDEAFDSVQGALDYLEEQAMGKAAAGRAESQGPGAPNPAPGGGFGRRHGED